MAITLSQIIEQEEQIAQTMTDLEKRRDNLLEQLQKEQSRYAWGRPQDAEHYWKMAEFSKMNQEIDDISGSLESNELQLDRLSVQKQEQWKQITPEDAKTKSSAIDNKMEVLDLNNRKKHLENEIKLREEAIQAGVLNIKEGDTQESTRRQLSINRAELDKALEELDKVQETITNRASVNAVPVQEQKSNEDMKESQEEASLETKLSASQKQYSELGNKMLQERLALQQKVQDIRTRKRASQDNIEIAQLEFEEAGLVQEINNKTDSYKSSELTLQEIELKQNKLSNVIDSKTFSDGMVQNRQNRENKDKDYYLSDSELEIDKCEKAIKLHTLTGNTAEVAKWQQALQTARNSLQQAQEDLGIEPEMDTTQVTSPNVNIDERKSDTAPVVSNPEQIETKQHKTNENPENWQPKRSWDLSPEALADIQKRLADTAKEFVENESETKKVEKTEKTDYGVR